MKNIKQYVLLDAYTYKGKLEAVINDMISMGFQPYKKTIIKKNPIGQGFRFFQAMVKYEN